MNKLKLYWNKQFPDTLYCLGKDTSNNPSLYVLQGFDENVTSYNPETALSEVIQSNGTMYWGICAWNTTKRGMKEQGFEFIGEL